MSNFPTISPAPPSLTSTNIASLRQIGMQYIRQLAAESWTDHNHHDPGISMLRVLAYAMTDLGNRLNLPVQDILQSQPGLEEDKLITVFPSAGTVLPNCAWTKKDLRKVLMDIEGVRNIHLRRGEAEVSLFFNEEGTNLSFSNSEGESERVNLNGLYEITVEFEPAESGEELNSNIIDREVEIGGNIYRVTFVLPYWDDLAQEWLQPEYEISSVSISSEDPDQLFPVNNHRENIDSFWAQPSIELEHIDSTDIISLNNFTINIHVSPEIEEGQPGEEELRQLLLNIDPNSILQEYKSRGEAIRGIIHNIEQTFHDNRNLCEDLRAIKGIRIQEIALLSPTTVELLPGADPSRILAEICFALEQFISPTIRRYTFEELWEQQNLPIDEILQGPILNDGFILDKDLDAFNPIGIVYTSDLISLIMDIPGVFAVHDLHIGNFANNVNLAVQAEASCIRLRPDLVPRFDHDRSISAVEFRRKGIDRRILSIDLEIVSQHLADLRTTAAEPVDTYPINLPIPQGENQELNRFFSIQEEFPLHYGIGSDGLSSSASPQRQAQARQLKAYLTIFDQILLNCAAQIANLCEFFSASEEVTQTYYHLPVYEAPNVSDLLHSFLDGDDDFEVFIENTSNTYITQLIAHTETEEVFINRRSRVLDHLLARNGEEFPDALSLMYENITRNYLQDKIRFLTDLHLHHSSNRGKALNYRLSDETWDTENVSGLEKRVARLLGMPNYNRRHLSEIIDLERHIEIYDEQDNDAIVELRFRIRERSTSEDPNSRILLSSSTRYGNENDLQEELENVFIFARHEGNYDIITATNGTFYFNLLDDAGEIIARRIEPFDTRREAEAEIDRIIAFFRGRINEGFHLIEHLLLRPISFPTLPETRTSNESLSTRFSSHGDFSVKDPYSFRMSWIFPSGYQRDFNDQTQPADPIIRWWRFQDNEFRAFIERTIREETPAHIMPEIHFLDVDTSQLEGDTASLNNFEHQYETWLTVRENSASTSLELASANNALIRVLSRILEMSVE